MKWWLVDGDRMTDADMRRMARRLGQRRLSDEPKMEPSEWLRRQGYEVVPATQGTNP